jgi:hypothetical protein|nr:MAG TPA: hypothetical protein [Bacteriophage sp.]DAW42555.1 MAG TPA: hypothetical protein [Bacteriophage sp.]
MRKKDNTTTTSFDVTAGIDFTDTSGTEIPSIQPVEKKSVFVSAPVDPNRVYTPGYNPTPKIGPNGGYVGRREVPAAERKIQFSVSCTESQKAAFSEAARKSGRTLAGFACFAIEEYMRTHDL